MKTKLTILAALLLAGASQAAMAQDHDHGGDRGGQAPAGGGWQGRGGGGQGHWNGGGGGQPQAQPAPAAPAAAAPAAQPGGQRFNRDGERHWDGQRAGGGERQWNGGGERRGFVPGAQAGAPGPGAAPGSPRWDRHDAPREVVPPVQNAERGWDRNHDGHNPADGRRLDGGRRWDGQADNRWNGDHRNWDRGQHNNVGRWERGRFPPVYAAQHRFRIGPYRAPYGFYVRSWAFGDFLPRAWYGSSYWIDDFDYYDLPYPPPGMHWVRVGDDALLVDDYSGRVMQVVRDIFW